jgi:phosphoesterase RecJ-like protein
MLEKKKAKQILMLLDKSEKVLITSHKDPDGDSLGSQLAWESFVSSLGKGTIICNDGIISPKYQFLDKAKKIVNQVDKTDFVPDLTFVLECPNLERTGWVKEMLSLNNLVNIDHHPDNTGFGKVNLVDPTASALGELIYNIFQYLKFPVSPQIATWLYASILTDTGRFRFSNTTPECLEICADLIRIGADPKYIATQIYFNFSESYLRLLGRLLQEMELWLDKKVGFLTITRQMLSEYGTDYEDTEGIVDYSLFMGSVEVGALFRELSVNKTKVSFRSHHDFDVCKLAKFFGGGGHKNAAGCKIDADLSTTKQMILNQIKLQYQNDLSRVFSCK